MVNTRTQNLLPASLLALPGLLVLAASVSAQDLRRAKSGLTVYRPQNGAGYFPFERTRVPEPLEEDPVRGPGIRVNGPGDSDPSGEDDLVELTVERVLAGASFVLDRSDPGLAVWGTRTRQPGTQLAFTGNRSAAIDFGGADERTLWVEWNGAAGVLSSLSLRALAPDVGLNRPVDRLVFHAFRGLVVALGGEGQVPQVPVDPNHGTFRVAIDLYDDGYDVLMSDEDAVSSDGSGTVYTAVVDAIQHRGVTELAVYGYSHGGGSTYDLCERLDTFHGTIGTFAVPFTSYVDGVQNDSDIDLDMETRRPLGSGWHANHYQHGSFTDFFLDGGPVTNSNPPPTGLDVETTPWGGGATHYLVDDYVQVRDFIFAGLEARMDR